MVMRKNRVKISLLVARLDKLTSNYYLVSCIYLKLVGAS